MKKEDFMKKEEKIDFRYNLSLYFDLLKPHLFYFVLLFLIVLIIESASLAEKFLFKLVIDKGTAFSSGLLMKSDFLYGLFILSFIYLFLIFLEASGEWFKIKFMNILDSSLILNLKKRFFNHILRLSYNFHTTHRSGSLISRLSRGANAIEDITDFFILNLAPLLLQIVLVGGSLFYFDFLTALSVFLTAVIFIGYSFFIIRKQQSANLKTNMAEDREKGMISDVFTNIDSIKYYGKEDLINKKYFKLVNTTRLAQLLHWDYFKKLESGQSFIIAFGTFLVVSFSIIKFLNGGLTIGSLVFVYAAYGSLASPLFGFVWGIRRFYKAMADFQALFEYDKIKNEIEDKKEARSFVIKKGGIEFKDVSFSYHNKPVIQNLNLKIKPHEKIAVVGYSGSGKTTLVKLLYRFYDIKFGKIKIDGVNIKDIDQEDLRSELSIVPQECILFDDTIHNNVAFSRPTASRGEIMKATKFAQLDKLILELPQKEKTIVGERGVKLSGGEKQRVSIARAILANKKILVLDEATSALDSKTEHEIQKDLQKLMKGRTSIIIAHRLSTIMKADRIIVVDKGRIVQVGKHKDLIKKTGIYRELWNLQKGGYIKE